MASSLACCCGGCPLCSGKEPDEVQFTIYHQAIDEDDVSFGRSVYCKYMHPTPSTGCQTWGYGDQNCRWGYCDPVAGETAIITMSSLALNVDFIFAISPYCYIATGVYGGNQIHHSFTTKPLCCFDINTWTSGSLYNNCRNDWNFTNTDIRVHGINCSGVGGSAPSGFDAGFDTGFGQSVMEIQVQKQNIITAPNKKCGCGQRIIERKIREV